LSVVRTVAGSPASRELQPGDLLLSIDGVPVTRMRDVEKAVQRERAGLLVLRGGRPHSVEVPTVALGGEGVSLQAPYREMAAQRGVEPYGVYVAFFSYGSPASRYGLLAGRRIVEVDGQPIPDLDRFIAAVKGKRDRESVRLTTVTWNNFIDVLTLKVDRTYWPAYEIRSDEEGWHTQPLE
jgi:S1-C subfamily serine protease